MCYDHAPERCTRVRQFTNAHETIPVAIDADFRITSALENFDGNNTVLRINEGSGAVVRLNFACKIMEPVDPSYLRLTIYDFTSSDLEEVSSSPMPPSIGVEAEVLKCRAGLSKVWINLPWFPPWHQHCQRGAYTAHISCLRNK